MKRLFVAIDLPDTIRRFLVELDPGLTGARWVSSEQMHLTLGFFGEISEPSQTKLQEHLLGITFGSFVLSVQNVGAFPAKGPPKIIWIGVGAGHPHLFQIHKRVQEAALSSNLEADLRPWHPHITLARCHSLARERIHKFLAENAELDAGIFRVEAFHLYSSRLTPAGSIYSRELTISSR